MPPLPSFLDGGRESGRLVRRLRLRRRRSMGSLASPVTILSRLRRAYSRATATPSEHAPAVSSTMGCTPLHSASHPTSSAPMGPIPMNNQVYTPMTRPRRESGDRSCRRVLAVVMKRMPHRPSPTSSPMVIACQRDRPRSIKQEREAHRRRPAASLRVGVPRAAIHMAASMEPTPREDVSAPRPAGPESNTYLASSGRTVMKL